MQWTILATKFHQPAKPLKQVQRLRLIQHLNEGLESGHLLTLISAPAGFGKTTCVTEWLSGLDLPAAWLALEKADDDPGRFFTYFIAALRQVDSRFGREIDAAIRAGQFPPVEAVSTALINDMLHLQCRVVLVLDDFQVVQDPTILQVLEKIITNRPEVLHLVLITREDPLLPLARLRANNQMTELRAADLRFSVDEISAFLAEVMDLPLVDADIHLLEQRTEGWIAGLQLAGLSMRGRSDPSSFIAGLSGSHRYILSYLTEEVLSSQPEGVQSFLLQTAILDRLNGELCDAVTGRTGSDLLLEQLFKANLFLIPLDDDRHWYRYHHLFADLLRALQNRAPHEETVQLHRRASMWYAAQGMIAEAIPHALAGEDYRQAVDLVEKHAMSVVMQGYFKTVEGWFQSIPPAWQTRSPRASLALAGMYLMRGSYALVAQYLQQAQPFIFSPDGETDDQDSISLRSEWLSIHSNLSNVQGRAAESLESARRALESARPDDNYTRGLAYLGMGGAYRLTGDYPKMVAAYQKAIQYSRAAGNWLSEMLSATALGLMAIQHGKLRFALETASQVIERTKLSGEALPPIAGPIYGVLGLVHYEWNAIEQARGAFQRELELNLLGGHNAGLVFARTLLSRLSLAEGDQPAAAKSIQEAVDHLALGIPAWLKPEVVLQQVRVAVASGNIAAAEVMLNGLGIDWRAPVTRPLEIYFLAYLRLLLHQVREFGQGEGSVHALEIASSLIQSAASGQRNGILLQALLVRAQLHHALDDLPAALIDLSRALELAEGEGYLRTFVDEGPAMAALLIRSSIKHSAYAARLLAAFPHTGEPVRTANEPSAALPEPLTDREMEVLRLIAEGLKYEQIADRLVISVNTVRFYVKEIYSKLQVNSRGQAVETARRLSML